MAHGNKRHEKNAAIASRRIQIRANARAKPRLKSETMWPAVCLQPRWNKIQRKIYVKSRDRKRSLILLWLPKHRDLRPFRDKGQMRICRRNNENVRCDMTLGYAAANLRVKRSVHSLVLRKIHSPRAYATGASVQQNTSAQENQWWLALQIVTEFKCGWTTGQKSTRGIATMSDAEVHENRREHARKSPPRENGEPECQWDIMGFTPDSSIYMRPPRKSKWWIGISRTGLTGILVPHDVFFCSDAFAHQKPSTMRTIFFQSY